MSYKTISQSQLGQNTAKNSQIVTSSVRLINSGEGGGIIGPTITSIIVTDSGYNNVSANLTSTNSYIKIFGTNFQANSNVFVQNVVVSSANITFTSSTELRVALPRLNITGTNLLLSVTNPNFYQSNTYVDLLLTVDYLVVAGGGGGGSYVAGGGGGGGALTGSGYELTLGTTYTVTVGAGGNAGAKAPDFPGGQGGNSVFDTITSTGGGGGAVGGGSTGAATSGGSGGGGGSANGMTAGAAGVNGQGYAGGNSPGSSGNYPSGGGGGAGGAGETPANTSAIGGAGGIGLFSSITGSSIGYAGGGGGGDGGTAGGVAGLGTSGGGNGGTYSAGTSGTAGTANLGGGGGGNGNGASIGSGGSGVVIIRHADTFPAATSTTGSPTITTAGGYRIYKFTSSGTITF